MYLGNKYRRLFEMKQKNLLDDALTYQTEQGEINKICGIKWELEKLCVDYVWRSGKENGKNSWKMASQRRVDIERQGMDTIKKERNH
jgi:hypothetical protein